MLIRTIYSVLIYIFICILVFFSANDFALLQQNEISIYKYNFLGLPIVDWFSFLLIGLGLVNIYKVKLLYLTPIHKGFLLFFVAISWGAFVAAINQNSFDLNSMGLQTWKNIIYATLIGVTFINFNYTKNQLYKFLDFFVFIVFLKSSIGLIKYLLGNGQEFYFLGKIVFSTVDTLFIICLAYFIVLNTIVFKKNKKLYYYIYLIIFFLVIILSLKRNFLLIMSCGTLLTLLFSSFTGKVKFILTLMILTCTLLPAISFTDVDLNTVYLRFKAINIFDKDNAKDTMTSDNGHIDDILDGIDNVKKEPILGQGFNAKIQRYRVGWQKSDTFLHNAYLAVWINMGLLGIILYVKVIWNIFKYGLTNLKIRKEKECKVLSLLLIQISTAIFIDGIAFAPIYTFVTVLMIIVILLSIVTSTFKFENMKLGEHHGK
ncbi:hypothetical protein HPK10_11515 [Anoxybacillus flavithermus]|uniref:O-antigen ligase family protein n=1 Tax=Anoxybacillus flavithermus TaxID=33934 RepID=UPI001866E2A9|nr:O-antigen ligase family protein [Anoxybacillus flavithermus]MBE2943850.1 hypothetical protein [Anoxybacillus flavithermus]MBE2952138.1 hypothetical protein [Anoxybacillus flavithermus]MBE2954745.1 hypothetical protein [Anoxybacillus flavithermus]MBE2960119.1 hypothetical protein [Anoxybacillus flavithermus]